MMKVKEEIVKQKKKLAKRVRLKKHIKNYSHSNIVFFRFSCASPCYQTSLFPPVAQAQATKTHSTIKYMVIRPTSTKLKVRTYEERSTAWLYE